ncbi:MAG: twin-arginine translocase TatA/TatE family subunit [Fimbriimonas sp.]|nr:twin-arginine translocase TatA/TatE family subunit [Fimbriimonas sp.]
MLNLVAMIGPEPLLLIFILVLVLFGGKKIPELMRGVGRGVGELQKGLEEGKTQLSNSLREEEEKRPAVMHDEVKSDREKTTTGN